MLINKTITYYHKGVDSNRLTTWTRYIFENAWVFGGKGGSMRKGYDNANNVSVRISFDYIQDESIFDIGDIICVGIHDNIQKQSDLEGAELYNVTSISVNDFGNAPHIHLEGK